MSMEYTSNEKQILSLMERTDFRNLSKNDVLPQLHQWSTRSYSPGLSDTRRAEWWLVVRRAGHSFALEHISHLLAGVLSVPLVEQVLHRNKVADSLGGVDVVHNGDVADAEAVEAFFQ